MNISPRLLTPAARAPRDARRSKPRKGRFVHAARPNRHEDSQVDNPHPNRRRHDGRWLVAVCCTNGRQSPAFSDTMNTLMGSAGADHRVLFRQPHGASMRRRTPSRLTFGAPGSFNLAGMHAPDVDLWLRHDAPTNRLRRHLHRQVTAPRRRRRPLGASPWPARPLTLTAPTDAGLGEIPAGAARPCPQSRECHLSDGRHAPDHQCRPRAGVTSSGLRRHFGDAGGAGVSIAVQ